MKRLIIILLFLPACAQGFPGWTESRIDSTYVQHGEPQVFWEVNLDNGHRYQIRYYDELIPIRLKITHPNAGGICVNKQVKVMCTESAENIAQRINELPEYDYKNFRVLSNFTTYLILVKFHDEQESGIVIEYELHPYTNIEE